MHDILDLNRYPLDHPNSPEWLALVARAKADLAREGMFDLVGFLRPAALNEAVAALTPRFAKAFVHSRDHNIYFRNDITEVPADHPALARVNTTNRTLCADEIGGLIQQVYAWAPFAQFLAATMDKPALYTMADPLAAVNTMAYGPGEGLNWHFDRSEFTTTLLLQAPEKGGAFEYRTDLRSADNPNYEGVANLLQGKDPALKSITLTPGTLNVFRGKNTAHRVTPVQGPQDRMIAVFSFYERPGVRFTPEEQKGFYGRVAA